jgi:hypothetical protein
MSDVIAQVPQHLTVVREIWCGFRDQNIIGLHKYSTTSQGSGGCHFLVHQTSPFLPRMNTGGILGWFGERLGPRPLETCRVYNRLEDWEDCRPSKDASPGTITALLSAQALHSSGKDVAAQYCLSGHMLHGRIQV